MNDPNEHPEEVQVIGAVLPEGCGLIYHVTLESGAIVTSPRGFGEPPPAYPLSAVITADGRFLSPPTPLAAIFDSPEGSEFPPMEPSAR
jgi:hypothetical protein